MQIKDIVVIGGGPAGYVAAIKAARLGASVALLEQRELGGTCLNRGCIPTKTLVDTAKWLDHLPDAKKRGLVFDASPRVDLKAAVQYKTRLTRRMAAGVGILLRENGIETFAGTGTVSPDLIVCVNDQPTIQAKKIIIATGTNPARLPIEGFDDPRVLTTDAILNLEQVPEKLAILGAGVAGVEFASIFRAFGSDVHLIEAMDRVCPFLDQELSFTYETILARQNVKRSLDTKLLKIEPREDGLALYLSNEQVLEATHLFVTVGRSVDLRAVTGLDLALERGYIAVNDNMQSSHPNIYAPGDVNGRCMLAHAAYRMGEIAAEHAVFSIRGEPADHLPRFSPTQIPGSIYSSPEMGNVGLTEQQAHAQYGDVLVGRFSLAANGRAMTAAQTAGFIKVIADARTERILGVHILGLYASELINEAATAVTLGLTIDQWAEAVHAHPTVSESLIEAALDAKSTSIHLPPNIHLPPKKKL